MPELAVVVPTLNERENILPLIERLTSSLEGIDWELIFVDDDSADGTAELCRRIGQEDRRVRTLQRVGRTGLASACIEGMLATCAPYIAVLDGDLQHDETQLPKMLQMLRGGSLDLVVGSRHAPGGGTGAFPEMRLRLSNLGKRLSQVVSRHPLGDPMSGFFVLDRRFLNEAVHRLSGIGFKILLDLVASSPRPVRLAEAPYQFRSRLHGESKLDVSVAIEYLLLIADKLIGNWVPARFALFTLVGAAGLLVHLLVLGIGLSAGASFWKAQVAATFLAMTLNFALNNVTTHRDRRLRGLNALRGLLVFYVACSLGAISNIALAKMLFEHGVPWYLAGGTGLVVGSVWNYAASSVLSWRRQWVRRQNMASAQRTQAAQGVQTVGAGWLESQRRRV